MDLTRARTARSDVLCATRRWYRSGAVLCVLLAACGRGAPTAESASGMPAREPEPAPFAPAADSARPGSAVDSPGGGASTVLRGALVAGVLGPSGGTLESADGRLMLTVPSGVLSSPVEFGIQAVSTHAPGAVADGFRLSPDGPLPGAVTLSFVVDDAQAGAAAELGVATRRSAERWQLVPAQYDPASRRMTARATHLSDWALVARTFLKATPHVLGAGRSADVQIVRCRTASDPELGVLIGACQPTGAKAAAWSVNGVPGGNVRLGEVRAGATGETATYRAPGEVLNPMTAVVSARAEVDGVALLLAAPVQVLPDDAAYSGTLAIDEVRPTSLYRYRAHVVFGRDGAVRGGTATRMLRNADCRTRTEQRGTVTKGSLIFVDHPLPDGRPRTLYRAAALLDFDTVWTCRSTDGDIDVAAAPANDLFDFHPSCARLIDMGAGTRFDVVRGDGSALIGHEVCRVGDVVRTLSWSLERLD